MVRLFTFDWDNVRNSLDPNNWFRDESLRVPHGNFNQAFVQYFPRILYTNPSTSYTDAGLGIGSRLTGLGETYWDDPSIKRWILDVARASGFGGNDSDLRFSAKSINELQQGQSLHQSPSTVDPLVTSDGSKDIFDIFKLSATVTVALALGAIFLLRRK